MNADDNTLYEPKRVPCRGCRKPIVWGTEEKTGKKIPLDPVPPVYEVEGFYYRDVDVQVVTINRHYKAYVSHFATCPNAQRFSSSAKRSSASHLQVPGAVFKRSKPLNVP